MTQKWEFDDRLEAYIDNVLGGEARAQFEQLLSGNQQLATLSRQASELNARLRRHFEPPPVPAWATAKRLGERHGRAGDTVAIATRGQPAAPLVIAPPPRSRRWPRRLAAAAAIALAVFGGWLAWESVRTPSGDAYDATQWRSLEQAYAVLEEPSWVCESDEVFAGTFAGRFGQPLLFQEPPGEPTMAGLAYCHSISRDTVCMVGSADGNSRIVVFVDRLERDTKPALSAASGLHLFRRELGQLVLYEISPKDHSTLLDWFYIPEGK